MYYRRNKSNTTELHLMAPNKMTWTELYHQITRQGPNLSILGKNYLSFKINFPGNCLRDDGAGRQLCHLCAACTVIMPLTCVT